MFLKGIYIKTFYKRWKKDVEEKISLVIIKANKFCGEFFFRFFYLQVSDGFRCGVTERDFIMHGLFSFVWHMQSHFFFISFLGACLEGSNNWIPWSLFLLQIFTIKLSKYAKIFCYFFFFFFLIFFLQIGHFISCHFLEESHFILDVYFLSFLNFISPKTNILCSNFGDHHLLI